jgi:hypothetical protein
MACGDGGEVADVRHHPLVHGSPFRTACSWRRPATPSLGDDRYRCAATGTSAARSHGCQACRGQHDDLPLLWCQFLHFCHNGRGFRPGNPASAQFCFGADGPGLGPQCAEGSSAALRMGLARLIRRCRRSHSPSSRRSCARSNGHWSPTGSSSTLPGQAAGVDGSARNRARSVPVVAEPLSAAGRWLAADRLDSHLGGACTLISPGRTGPATRESAWKKLASASSHGGPAFR